MNKLERDFTHRSLGPEAQGVLCLITPEERTMKTDAGGLQVLDTNNPGDTEITVLIKSTSQGAGVQRLIHAFYYALLREGYTNVGMTTLASPGAFNHSADASGENPPTLLIDPVVVQAQKAVKIHIAEDVSDSPIREMIEGASQTYSKNSAFPEEKNNHEHSS